MMGAVYQWPDGIVLNWLQIETFHVLISLPDATVSLKAGGKVECVFMEGAILTDV